LLLNSVMLRNQPHKPTAWEGEQTRSKRAQWYDFSRNEGLIGQLGQVLRLEPGRKRHPGSHFSWGACAPHMGHITMCITSNFLKLVILKLSSS
jgi:hypothetical protein